jgi:RecA-family ATPase
VADKRDDFDVFDGPPPGNIVALKPTGKQQKRIVLSLPEFLAQYKPPDYLIDGLVQRGFFYSLTGRTGVGKTAVAILIAILVAMRWRLPWYDGDDGRRKLGPHEVERGRVLYITKENPTDVRMRLIGAAAKIGFDRAALDFLVVEDIQTIDRNVLRQIKQEVEGFGELALVIVDTSFALFPGDEENSNSQVGRHARMQRKLCDLPGRPCVITLCHPVKNAGDNKESMIPRGGGAFLNEVDGNFCLTSGGERIVEMHWTGKFRGAEFEKISFQLETVHTTDLLDSKGRILPTVMARAASDEQVQEAEKAAVSQERVLLEAMSGDPNGSLTDWAKKCGWFIPGKDGSPPQPNKQLVHRVMKRLVDQKLATKLGRDFKLTKAGEKAMADRL